MMGAELLHTATKPAKRAEVLIVDDDEHMGEALCNVLEAAGYEVHHEPDGHEALRYLRAGHVPDLILLDLMMPNMNGWEFRLQQRLDPLCADIPVIAMSADGSPQAAAIDAAVYLRKPVDDLTLLDSVEKLVAVAKRAREDARQAELERLSQLGLIAAGMAHEINNPLAFITGNLELVKRHLRELEAELSGLSRARLIAMGRLLESVDHGAQRIADVVRSVAAFSRPDGDRVGPVNVVEVLESSIQLADNVIRHRARLCRKYLDVPPVLGNAAKLGQVFLNLLTQAAHALDDRSTSEAEIRVGVSTAPSGAAVITISDTGPGIAPAHLARVFEPFVSGTGMGPGLAVSQRIVLSMGGTIGVESQPGKGTTFRVTLPASDQTPNLQSQRSDEAAAQSRPRMPKLLVVDDETMMCELLQCMLGDDYEVHTRESAQEALEEILAGASYDLILCDVMMPDLSGMDVHAELLRVRPDQAARMVFMTGGTFSARAQAFVERLSETCLAKPFRPDEVSALLERRLSQLGLLGESMRAVN